MTDQTHLLPWIVFVPFAAALLALWIGRWLGRRTGVLMVLAAAASFAMSVMLFVGGLGGEGISGGARYFVPWMPAMNIGLGFRGDPFGLFFALLVSGIGILVGIYSLNYIGADLRPARVGRYYAALIAFMGSMLGVALADDLMLLFVFWEITSVTSFLLIGFWYERDIARRGAMTALQVTALGGLVMMVGFIVVGVVTGTFSISELTGDPQKIQKLLDSPLALTALALILAGAFTKSAQVPFHFWLPGAMVAPTPVSTYLHAATMVKAGIFLVGRMLPVFGNHPAWTPVLVTVGLATFVLGAYQAVRETDLKGILARSTVSTLGMVMMVYGLKAADQDALQILNHAAYKGGLFLVAGIIEHAAHTRDIRKLGGLRKDMPITFWLCVLTALSMAGVPPFFGFLAKESLYGALLANAELAAHPQARWLVIGLCVLANACIFAVACRLIFGIFLGKKPADLDHVHEAAPGLWAPAAVLATLAVALGLAYPLTSWLANHLSSAGDGHLHVSLWPEHWEPLTLSALTMVLGLAIYKGRTLVAQLAHLLDKRAHGNGAQQAWDGGMALATWAGETFSARWQSGSLRWYLGAVMSALVGLVVYGLYRVGIGLAEIQVNLREMSWYGLALCVLLGMATWILATARTRLGAAITTTAVGFLVSLLFVVYRSPDILLTQILIETVSTIFFLLVVYFMPPFKREHPSPPRKLVNLGISAAVGVTITVLLLLCMSPPYRELHNLGAGYLSRSLAEGGGANAVNVIIVDIRAMDTNGEITVLVVVGLCVYGLLRARRRAA